MANVLRGHDFAHHRIIDISRCTATKERCAVRIVHRYIRLQTLDEIRIGEDHLTIGF